MESLREVDTLDFTESCAFRNSLMLSSHSAWVSRRQFMLRGFTVTGSTTTLNLASRLPASLFLIV